MLKDASQAPEFQPKKPPKEAGIAIWMVRQPDWNLIRLPVPGGKVDLSHII